jgi:hypothetical protein
MEGQPSILAPQIEEQIIVTFQHTGNGVQLVMQQRRVTYVEGGIVLAVPKTEPMSESTAIALLCECVKAGAVRAIQAMEHRSVDTVLRA